MTVGVEMLRNSYYRGTAGAPSYGTRASLANLGPADVAGFITAHYLRGDAFATATGSVDDAANTAVSSVLSAFPDGNEAAPVLAAQAFGPEPKHLVTQRSIGVPFALVGFAAPAMSDRDFAAMLVLRSLLNDIASRQSTTTLAPFQRGIDVVYAYDVKPATFTVAINGSELDPTAGLTVLQAILKTAVTKPLAADVVKRYKETARGEWALEAMTLTDRAWQIGAAVNQGAGPDARAERYRGDRSRDAGRRAAARQDLPAALHGRARSAAPPFLKPLRVALVHDYLNQRGGGSACSRTSSRLSRRAGLYVDLLAGAGRPRSQGSRSHVVSAEFPFQTKAFSRFRAALSGARSNRSICAVTTRSSVPRRRGPRA